VPTRLARNVSSNNGVSVQPKNRYALETTVLGLEGLKSSMFKIGI